MTRRIVVLALFTLLGSVVAQGQLQWEKSPENPVMPAWSRDFDDASRYYLTLEPSVLPPDGQGVFRMYFASRASGAVSICVSTAISTDGVHWYPYAKNPVLRPGNSPAFDERSIYSADVVRVGANYMMYYSGMDLSGRIAIGLATSPDGLTWEKYSGNPVIELGGSGSWESHMAEYPRVVYDGERYHMWYTGQDGVSDAVGYASSEDGINWTKHPGNPVFVPAAGGAWDDQGVSATGVAHHDSLYYMMYMGTSVLPADWRSFGLATSRDGVSWTRLSADTLLSVGPSGAWDDGNVGGGCLRFLNGEFVLYYTALDFTAQVWQIGMATSPLTPVSVGERPETVPGGYSLAQSYPNPFNPMVTVEFSLPREEFVTIIVFDALGREVVTLAHELWGPGRHRVVWEAANAASGKYWYRMQAGAFTDTKSMVLLH